MSAQRADVSKWTGLVAGLVAAAAECCLMLILRMTAGIATYPELIGNALGAHVPLDVFRASTGALGTETKPALFIVLVAIMIGVGGALGVRYARRLWRDEGDFRRGALLPALRLAGIVWIVVMVVVTPLTGAGIGGAALPDGGTSYLIAGLFLHGCYALVLATMTTVIHRAFAPANAPGSEVDEGRRAFLHNAAIGATFLSLGGLALTVRQFAFPSSPSVPTPVQPSEARLDAEQIAADARARVGAATDPAFILAADKLPDEVTDSEHFYVISKNFADPVVRAETWHIAIDGLVERPTSVTYDDLLALPRVTFLRTMECISNRVGGNLISNGQWTGTPLHMLLERAGVGMSATKVKFTGTDGYTTAIPIAEALDPATVLVTHLNDAPLSSRHGFPARLIVPPHYGMKNPKWITQITLVSENYEGFWERQGWTDESIVETTSRIDTPTRRDALHVGVPTAIGGLAYAGNRGISDVAMSTDDGKTWEPAALQPALGALTWVFWAATWTPPAAGNYTLVVRATDGTGAMQREQSSSPIPDGATGYHRVKVSVKA